MDIHYSTVDQCTPEEVSGVFIRSGIKRPSGDRERIRRMLEHADVIVTARESGRLIGILRAVTDYSYCCYISDIAVEKESQGLGIGSRLIQQLQSYIGSDEVQYILIAAPDAVGFYEKMGLERVDRAFIIRRKV